MFMLGSGTDALLACPALENGIPSPLKPMTQLSRPRSDQVCSISQLSERLLQDLASADFLLLVLPNRQWGYEVLTSPAADEEKVLFANLHADLLLRIVELTNATAFGESGESELDGVGLSEMHDIQPADWGRRVVSGSNVLSVGMRGDDFGWSVKAALEALDLIRTERTGAQVAGQRFMTVEDVAVGAEDFKNSRKGVVFLDEGKVDDTMASEIVNLELVAAVATAGACGVGTAVAVAVAVGGSGGVGSCG